MSWRSLASGSSLAAPILVATVLITAVVATALYRIYGS